jgi:hypothetical protein
MNHILLCLLTLLFSLSGPAMGEYSDFGSSSLAANGGARAVPSSARNAITSRGLNLPGIINDARMGVTYRVNSNIPVLCGLAAGGMIPEIIIDSYNFRHLQL